MPHTVRHSANKFTGSTATLPLTANDTAIPKNAPLHTNTREKSEDSASPLAEKLFTIVTIATSHAIMHSSTDILKTKVYSEMQINHLHEWDLSPKEAIQLQKDLSERVIDNQPIDLSQIKTIAGVDVSVKKGVSQAAIVVMSYPDLEPIETVHAQQPTSYPYIPGLLTFREGVVLEEAFLKLKHEPDVFIFDGMGKIHPRQMGIASHMGLWLDRPTIGCGKTHFIGEYAPPAIEKGAYSELTYKGDVLGVVLRTRTNVKPVYISVGHRADLTSAIELILAVTPKYRLPHPIRLAHNAAGEF